MARRHILLASPEAKSPGAELAFKQLSDTVSVMPAEDGLTCVRQFMELAQTGVGPLVTIIDYHTTEISGPSLAHALRSMERGFGLTPSAIVMRCEASDREAVAALIPNLGRAVQLTKKPAYTEEQQMKRLVKACEKVLVQLKGRGKR
ncbi:MAG: hypothetical protein VX589_02230 [Myxococcota bacterium]|nr:hypothetical protein [Myxococcota bacterium]